MGGDWKWSTKLSFTFHWSELSHLASPNDIGGWKKCEFVVHPGKKRNRSVELLAVLGHSVPSISFFLACCLFLVSIG